METYFLGPQYSVMIRTFATSESGRAGVVLEDVIQGLTDEDRGVAEIKAELTRMSDLEIYRAEAQKPCSELKRPAKNLHEALRRYLFLISSKHLPGREECLL